MYEKIKLTFTKNKEQMINDCIATMVAHGVEFDQTGDIISFNGFGISGSAHFFTNEVEITIVKKPFLVPMVIIMGRLRSVFS